MSLSFTPHFHRLLLRVAIAGVLGLPPLALNAQAKRKNPASKVYVSDVSGDALIDNGELVQDLGKRSVYNAEGAIIETKSTPSDRPRKKTYSTMVYSNGTGAFFDADTRVEMKRFNQEPFTPMRTDMDVEPSISQTQAFLSRGSVGLCTSKLVAGSSMVYQTPHGAVHIRGRKVVIETGSNETKISMLEGEGTVRAGPQDTGGHSVRAGQQAIIRRGTAGQPNSIEISRIPAAESSGLDDKVSMACMAKRTVYFEVRERPVDLSSPTAGSAETAATSGGEETGSTFPGTVTAFDGNSAAPIGNNAVREIVPVAVVPETLPVTFTISPAKLSSH
ncbi:MAG: hypothetical protein Q7S40_08140 [Opitutaceae bacterium]|nr:hypothetical protein [Opitutaceae bacterium]